MSDKQKNVSLEGEGKMDGRTFMFHGPADFLPSLEIPNFDDLVSALSRGPFTTCGDAVTVLLHKTWAGKDKDQVQHPFE